MATAEGTLPRLLPIPNSAGGGRRAYSSSATTLGRPRPPCILDAVKPPADLFARRAQSRATRYALRSCAPCPDAAAGKVLFQPARFAFGDRIRRRPQRTRCGVLYCALLSGGFVQNLHHFLSHTRTMQVAPFLPHTRATTCLLKHSQPAHPSNQTSSHPNTSQAPSTSSALCGHCSTTPSRRSPSSPTDYRTLP